MTDGCLKPPWLLFRTELGCALAYRDADDRPTTLHVGIYGPTDEGAEAVARHIVDLHNANLAPQPDPWIDLASLGAPYPGTWPWDSDPVLIHSASTIPNEPGRTGMASYRRSAGYGWDWWWAGHDHFRDPPVRGIDGPVTHVRRLTGLGEE